MNLSGDKLVIGKWFFKIFWNVYSPNTMILTAWTFQNPIFITFDESWPNACQSTY